MTKAQRDFLSGTSKAKLENWQKDEEGILVLKCRGTTFLLNHFGRCTWFLTKSNPPFDIVSVPKDQIDWVLADLRRGLPVDKVYNKLGSFHKNRTKALAELLPTWVDPMLDFGD